MDLVPVPFLSAHFLTLLGLWLLSCGCSYAPTSEVSNARFRVGDDVAWSGRSLNDADWDRAKISDAPSDRGIVWGRFDVLIDGDAPLGALVSAAAAREVYWDGVLIGRVGRVGDSPATEEPGPIDALLAVPDELAGAGPHVLAIRFSAAHRPAGARGLLLRIEIGDIRTLAAAPLRSVVLPLTFLGAFLIVGLYFAALFAAGRERRATLWSALLCAAVAALLVVELSRPLGGYNYDLHGLRLALVDLGTFAVGLLLAGAFFAQLRVRGGWVALTALAVSMALALLGVPDHEAGTWLAFALALATGTGITIRAMLQGRTGARPAFVGTVACLAALLVARRDFMDAGFSPAFSLVVLGSLTSFAWQSRAERREYDRARLAAARLEAELLKRHLQPHFLMNTLTSILELVETDPPQGARAIEALAVELRALSEVSDERFVTMGRELALCEAHLAVMGFRKGLAFELDAAGVDEAGLIPPAVFHTLIENAVTHNAYAAERVVFVLREDARGGVRRLTLRAPMAGAAESEPRREGRGLAYVRARLAESLPGSAALASGPSGSGDWVTTIEISTPGATV